MTWNNIDSRLPGFLCGYCVVSLTWYGIAGGYVLRNKLWRHRKRRVSRTEKERTCPNFHEETCVVCCAAMRLCGCVWCVCTLISPPSHTSCQKVRDYGKWIRFPYLTYGKYYGLLREPTGIMLYNKTVHIWAWCICCAGLCMCVWWCLCFFV